MATIQTAYVFLLLQFKPINIYNSVTSQKIKIYNSVPVALDWTTLEFCAHHISHTKSIFLSFFLLVISFP